MAKIQLGIIGAGAKGRQHMGILEGFEDVQLAALCDPVAEARDSAAAKFGIGRCHADLEAFLAAESEALDAVFVATPPDLNATAALPCLQRGLHTFMEKPPGMSAAETAALRDAAAARGVLGMVGWNRRFHAMILKAKKRVAERGPIVQLVGEFHKSLSRFEASGRYSEVFLDNMMWESINHSVDLVRALANSEVVEVNSVVRRALHKYRDVFGALVLFENNCLAHLIFNWTSDARLERYEIHGRDISVYLEGVDKGVVFCDGQRHELPAGSSGTEEEDRYFVDCVKEGRPISAPACSLEEAVKTMQLGEAIHAGLRP